jgi:hypothetical protein
MPRKAQIAANWKMFKTLNANLALASFSSDYFSSTAEDRSVMWIQFIAAESVDNKYYNPQIAGSIVDDQGDDSRSDYLC